MGYRLSVPWFNSVPEMCKQLTLEEAVVHETCQYIALHPPVNLRLFQNLKKSKNPSRFLIFNILKVGFFPP